MIRETIRKWFCQKAEKAAAASEAAVQEKPHRSEAAQPGEDTPSVNAAVPKPPVHQPFQLDPPPEKWSLEWERTQLERLRDFSPWQRTYEDMKAWEETLRYQKVEMARNQPPLVQEMLVRYLEAGHGLECVHDPDDLNEAWNYCDMRHKPEFILDNGQIADHWQKILDDRYASLTEEGKALVEELEAHWEEWYPAWLAAREHILHMNKDTEQKLKSRWERELEQFMADYQNHLNTLPPEVLPLVGYEIGRAKLSQGHSGFHGLGANPTLPFQACGWADYDDPDWKGAQGVGFRINRKCFDERDALLYYFDDDRFPREEGTEKILSIIRQYSSGIACVRVDSVVDEKGFAHRAILFRLDEEAIRETVCLSGQDVATKELGGYVFVLPRAGEFYCELGEVVNGRAVPLHIDDFCMK